MFHRSRFMAGCSPYHYGFGRRMHGGNWRDEVRTRRGDIKFLLLELLAEKPRHGYDLIRELETRNGGFYRPSAGSIYPTLQMLEEGGFLTSSTVEGKRVYTITETGQKLLAERGARTADREDDFSRVREQRTRLAELRRSAMELGGAVLQAARHSAPERVEKVEEILSRAKREIYAILAESK